MKSPNLMWYLAEKEDLPGIGFGIDSVSGSSSFAQPLSRFAKASAAVGFSKESSRSIGYHPPSLFVLRDEAAPEILSWLRVFSREAFPLSQFARVVTQSDWETFTLTAEDGGGLRTDKWASVILSEVLAQGEPDAEVAQIPISRSLGCFSFTMARAAFVHGAFSASRACAERLRAIEDDRRFVKRPVAVDSLLPVWSSLTADIPEVSNLKELIDLVFHAAESSAGASAMSAHQILGGARAALLSDSVEERVVAFQKLGDDILAGIAKTRTVSPVAAAVLATGAFLVGRSTSHVFLLRKYPELAPSAYMWFGLLAALRGPRGWDQHWSRICKGIERQLRGGFSWDDPPIADVCWTEYAWLSRTASGMQAFSDLARSLPRTLSIEVVPGAVCQFRSAADPRPIADPDRRATESVSRETELRALLRQIATLVARGEQTLDASSHSQEVARTQQQLPLPVREASPTKKPRSRRNYKKPTS